MLLSCASSRKHGTDKTAASTDGASMWPVLLAAVQLVLPLVCEVRVPSLTADALVDHPSGRAAVEIAETAATRFGNAAALMANST
jgi:hypothetical protein